VGVGEFGYVFKKANFYLQNGRVNTQFCLKSGLRKIGISRRDLKQVSPQKGTKGPQRRTKKENRLRLEYFPWLVSFYVPFVPFCGYVAE